MAGHSATLGQEFERHGDERVYEGDLAKAKIGYGEAIDAYIDAGLYEAAIRTCRKLIRLAPDVIRTHYTLLYLLTGEGRVDDAIAVLRDYAAAVRTGRQHDHAIPLLVLLMHVTDATPLREEAARALAELGARPAGERALKSAEALDRAGILGARDRWGRLLRAAVQ